MSKTNENNNTAKKELDEIKADMVEAVRSGNLTATDLLDMVRTLDNFLATNTMGNNQNTSSDDNYSG